MVFQLPEGDANVSVSTMRFVFAGTLLGLVVDLAVFPAELVKTRLQVSRNDSGTVLSDSLRLCSRMWREEGIRGFYRGSLSYIAGGLPSQVMYFAAYKVAKEKAEATFGGSVSPLLIYGTCGVIADLAATPFWIPVDIVSQRLQLQGSANVVQYKNARAAISTIYKADGVRGFFKGSGAAVVTYAPASAIWWTTYEYGKKWLMDNGFDYGDNPDGSAFVHTLSGFASGALSSMLTNPLDIAKTRLQTQDIDSSVIHKSKGIAEELVKMFKVEGPKSVFRGMLPRTLFYGICSSATFVCYELALRWSRI